MFIYFIQKKQFLNNDPDYLRHHLEESKQKGKDKFYTDFLCPLFFEGFAKKKRSTEIRKLLGNVPYLNGGIFEQHQIEELHGEKIQIPDKAFEQLFDFFDDYRWHLDERPNKDDKEINPDVLGYIFEKYINQKQMGAYYTKEDITEYISKNTIIPHLFDVAQKECKVAFEGEGSVWRHLQVDPDRYIYEAVRKGADKTLPAETAAGESDPKRREGWNKPAPEEFALPTEIWREVVARRRRYQEVKEKLAGGEVQSINDLITLNLDIRQFAQDVIQDSDADLLLAFWKAISQIKVLDPTVGSGAFLFAALNVLEPLYEACVERMSALVEELDRSGEKHSLKKYEPFRKVLVQVRQRPDEDYFIFKSIIINNLYGVDIMEEAVEICKLRLFLKLASQVEPDQAKENLGIEPLPDIDFNIRAGNTLVGFATQEDVERSVKMGIGSAGGKEKVQADKLFAMPEENKQLNLIKEKAEDVDRLYKLFRQQQTEFGGEVNADDKKKLEKKLEVLEDELNVLLAKQYGIPTPPFKKNDIESQEKYEEWLKSHTPFHWFVEFFGIMNEGGFDVIIGNPPYVEYSKVKKEYRISNYATEECGNLYAYVMERSTQLLNSKGLLGLIVPISITSSARMSEISGLLRKVSSTIWTSSYGIRPSKLFDGAEQRLSIVIAYLAHSEKRADLFTTKYHRWYSEERANLFSLFEYALLPKEIDLWGRTGTKMAASILSKLQSSNSNIEKITSTRATDNFIFYQEATGYWIKSLDGLPYYNKNGKVSSPAHGRYIYFRKSSDAGVVNGVVNSSLLFFYFCVFSDGYHLGDWLVKNFKIQETILVDQNLIDLAKKLSNDLVKNASRKSLSTKDGDKITYDELDGVSSKPIMDEIDRALARHYGLSDEELDFIINYDVKYRMGASAGEEEDSE
jgi:tRNA1(Val) A37 N6-methylase TrmN6